MKKNIKIILFLLIFGFIGISLSLFIFKNNKSYEIEKAKPIIVVSGPSSINITDDSDYFLDNENIITISNKKDNEINDTAMKYWLEFTSDNLNINDIDIEVKRNNIDVSVSNGNTEEFILKNSEYQKDTFKIKIKYNNTNDYIGTIYIYVKAQQIQPE